MGVTNGWLTGIFGAPRVWALDTATGKLTHTSETPQFKASIEYARDLWQAGVYHPNALQYNLVSARNDFAARRFAFRFDGFQSASITFWDNAPNLEPARQAAHHVAVPRGRRRHADLLAERPNGHPGLQRHQAGAARTHQGDAAHPELAGGADGLRGIPAHELRR